jgi:hypothetical protein
MYRSCGIMMAASARTRPLAQACAIVLAAWLAGACNQALGLDPVALDDDASVVPVDAAACDPVVAAEIAGGAAVDNVFARGVAAAAMYGNRLFLVGTHDSRGTDGALAAISFPATAGATWATRSIGGAANDQLWAVASTGDELLAGGTTRSFQTSGLDEGLLIWIDAGGAMAGRRLRAGVANQVRAIAVASAGAWWIAGAAGDTSGMLARLDSGATSVAANAFTIDGARPMPRRVVDSPVDSGAPFVVGQLGGGTETGFVARVDTTPDGGDTSWAVTVPMEVFDAAWFDASLWVAGNAGADGVLLRFDGDGALLASWRLPLRPLHRVGLRGGTIWLGGATSTGVFVATLTGDCVTGTDLATLVPSQPLRATLPLGLDGAVPFLAARVGTLARAIPLGEDATATCGVPFALVREPATITPTAATYATSAPVMLFHEAVSAIFPVVNVNDQATTCPL